MQVYDESNSPIKFFNVSKDGSKLGIRGLSIYYQLLNGLDVPAKFHEAAVALLVCHDWSYMDGFQPVTMMKMSRAITTLNGGSHEKAYNRLKQNVPNFIDWLNETGIDLFEAERGTGTRDPNKYKINYFAEIREIMNMDLSVSQARVRAATDRLVLKIRGKRVDVIPRKRREKKPEDPIEMIAKGLAGVSEMDMLPGHIALEVSEKLEQMSLDPGRIKAIVQMLDALASIS